MAQLRTKGDHSPQRSQQWNSGRMRLTDPWPEPDQPPRTPRQRRSWGLLWPWLGGVTVGLLAWMAVLGLDEPAQFAAFGILLVTGLAVTAGLAGNRLPAWLVGPLLFPGLILGTSAASYLIGFFSTAEGLHPLNGYAFWFGAIWAAASLVAVALLTTSRALASRARHN